MLKTDWVASKTQKKTVFMPVLKPGQLAGDDDGVQEPALAFCEDCFKGTGAVLRALQGLTVPRRHLRLKVRVGSHIYRHESTDISR